VALRSDFSIHGLLHPASEAAFSAKEVGPIDTVQAFMNIGRNFSIPGAMPVFLG
jgi:hypothetical protein